MTTPLQLKPEVMVFFGMRSQPFDKPEKASDIYPTQNMQTLQDQVEESLLTRDKLLILSGDRGIGSSTMAQFLIGSGTSHKLVYFYVHGNPSLNSTEILLIICKGYEDQELLAAATRQGKSMSKFASSHLFDLMKRDLQPVIVIDQAQAVGVRLINDIIRFCEAVNARKRGVVKLLLVFSGKIGNKIDEVRGEWITNNNYQEFVLEGLKKGEAKKYLLHRMKAAGLSVKLPFTEQTIMVLAERSRGIPAALDRLVVESLNSRVPTLMRTADESHIGMSEDDKREEQDAIKQERRQKILRIAIILFLVGACALGLALSL